MPETTPAQRAVQEIVLGHCDGELVSIHEAIVSRIEAEAATLAWRLRCGGLEVRQDDLTLDEAEALERVTGKSWTDLAPAGSVFAFRTIVMVCGAARLQWTKEQIDTVLPKTAAGIAACVDFVEVAPVPLDASGTPDPSTTSEPAPPSSDGPEKSPDVNESTSST